jgi:hypothetical protein
MQVELDAFAAGVQGHVRVFGSKSVWCRDSVNGI